jgi:hypothetical protein
MNLRRIVSLSLLASCLLACDKGDANNDATNDANKAKAADEAEAKPSEAEATPEPKPAKLELPWRQEQISDAMRSGTTLIYKQTGKDAAGKAVEDDYRCEIKRASKTEVGTVCNGVNHPSKDKGANEVATAEWNSFSPFFGVSRPESKLVERAELTVPAGTFDTVQVELSDFFGASYTVWMIADKPGIYAKVHKHANTVADDDQTDMVFELAEIGG